MVQTVSPQAADKPADSAQIARPIPQPLTTDRQNCAEWHKTPDGATVC